MVTADNPSSPLYNIKMGTINITGGTKTSPSFKLNDTVGQTVQGKFENTGFQVKAGFQYVRSRAPFSFTISNSAIDFGSVIANTFAADSSTLTVSVGSANGYSVKAIENHSPKVASTENTIPDTSCDAISPCAINQAAPWIDTNSYGFGYNMKGLGVNQNDFIDKTYYQPFPNNELGQDPITIMSGTNIRNKTEIATITYKINIPPTQLNGIYENAIQFIAIPSF
ncbi:hypothetical protein HYS10_01350 [Candidatus Collierbacteria bacterium]|nr:hypothetical protein [Candidatus Collierbacteria bacterium]